MQINRRHQVTVVALFLICATLNNVAQAATFKKGQKFPAFTLKTIEGKTISPASLKNKAYWITFFSSG